MRLLSYMKQCGLTDDQIAERMGAPVTARAVRKWKYGETSPRLTEAVRLEEITGGAVTARDFVEPAKPESFTWNKPGTDGAAA